MTKTNDFIWKGLQIITWIIFAGFCVQTGALLFNYIYSLFRPIATHNLHLGLNLSAIYDRSIWLYTCLFSFILVLSAMKAWIFYLVIRIFKKLNLVKPFSPEIADQIGRISQYALGIGIISAIAHEFTKRLIHRGYDVNNIESYWNDSDAYLMMAAVLFVINLLFQKGIELQTENDLTV